MAPVFRRTLAIKGLAQACSGLKTFSHDVYRNLCWEAIGLFRKSVTVSTKQGVFCISCSDQVIGRTLYWKRRYEETLMHEVPAFLRRLGRIPARGRGAVVDVGANNGVTSIGLLVMEEFERAVAVEPEPRNFAFLERNVSLNKLKDRILCLPYAATDSRSEVFLSLSNTNSGDHRIETGGQENKAIPEQYEESQRETLAVQGDTLDSLLARIPSDFSEDIALLWVDAQGHEAHVFRGANDLLSKGMPVVAEIWPYGLARAGTTAEQFCEITRKYWSGYAVRRRHGFVRYPIDTFGCFLEELGEGDNFDNAIFLP